VKPISAGSPLPSTKPAWTPSFWSRLRLPASATPDAEISQWRPTACSRGAASAKVVPFVYAGAAILTPAFFCRHPGRAFVDGAAVRPRRGRRRLCGLRLEAVWMHVGTPDAIKAAEEAILESAA